MKISILTSCAPFKGIKERIQDVALYSLTKFVDCEIIVLGDDQGVNSRCENYGFHQIADVPIGRDIGIKTSGGIVMGAAFERAKEVISGDAVLFINGDNIVIPSKMYRLIDILKKLGEKTNNDFVGWGRRFELVEYAYLLESYTIEEIFDHVIEIFESGALDPIVYGIDVYLWSRQNFEKLKPLPVLIDGWFYDNWLGSVAYKLSENVFYLNEVVRTVHCTHPDSSSRQRHENLESSNHNREVIQDYMPGINIFKLATPPMVLRRKL